MAVHNSTVNILASSYAISCLGFFRALGRMPSSLVDMLTSHLPILSNAPCIFFWRIYFPYLLQRMESCVKVSLISSAVKTEVKKSLSIPTTDLSFSAAFTFAIKGSSWFPEFLLISDVLGELFTFSVSILWRLLLKFFLLPLSFLGYIVGFLFVCLFLIMALFTWVSNTGLVNGLLLGVW